ncbi:cytochrome b [Methylocella sp.]|uniref:cytochrome b n=1 Tax=Methylocella sp. TaxID=1978226 RepID=UPI0037845955
MSASVTKRECDEVYDPLTIALHWSVAGLVVGLWIIGQVADLFPKGPLRGGLWSTHVVLGFFLAVLVVWRLAWRVSRGRRLPPSGGRALAIAAKAVQGLMYLTLLAVILLGVVNAFVRGFNLFGVFSLPQIGDRELRKPITEWHELAANLLLALALLHAGAALFHHYALKDGVLLRMAPGLRRAAPDGGKL